MEISKKLLKRLVLLALLLTSGIQGFGGQVVYYGGLAFVGNYSEFRDLYTYSHPVSELKHGGLSEVQSMFAARVKAVGPTLRGLDLKTDELASLGDGDALVLAIAIDNEVVSTYHVGGADLNVDIYKVTAELGAQILVFDYQSRSIVASIPIIVQKISAVEGHPPSDEFKSSIFRSFLLTEGNKTSLVDLFIEKIQSIDLKRHYGASLQVRNVTISDKSDKWLPPYYLRNKKSLERAIGQNFGKYLSDNAGVNVLPYLGNTTGIDAESRSIGNTNAAIAGSMALRFEDGDVFQLAIPKADYVFDLTLRGFSKSAGKENLGGQMWVYGSYVNAKLIQPTLGKEYFTEDLKNVFLQVLVKGHPSSIDEDWRCFREATYVLFDNLTRQFVSKPDQNWAKTHGQGKSTVSGLKNASRVLDKCKR